MQNFLRCKEINVMAVLETKLNETSVEEIMRRKFNDWHFTHNFASHNAGRILILWKQDKIHLSVLESNAQLIHCAIDCKITAKRLQVWFNSFGNSVCEVMEFISISDHTPLVVTTELVVPRGNSPFKFNNAIVDHPNFLRIVADVWKQNIHGYSMFKVCKKLKALKAPLKNLFKQDFSNISNRVELVEAEYNSVLNSLKQNPQDPSLLALANRTRGQTIMLRKTESMKFAQLIKNKYLLQADKCSKFFHVLIKRNRHSRFIAAIRLKDGHNTSSQDEIDLAFVNHFRNLFSAHELTQTPSISICNRDDIMLLSRGDIPSVSTMFAKLQHFCRVSELSISSDKSVIYSAGIRPHELSHIQQLTGFSLGDFPFRYLGVPLLSSRLNVCHYAPLLSKITGLIQGWNKKSLSYAGKLELIRAVIQGIVNFWMRIFPLPQSVLDRINASCRNFLWGKADIGKNKPLVAWSVVCSPKKEGGLGLFNLKDLNLALLSRILWDFHCKKDSL
ncbi:putative ribonuclease H protein [Glycine max]|nr:putative ribonuclease H protein [Glycine max]